MTLGRWQYAPLLDLRSLEMSIGLTDSAKKEYTIWADLKGTGVISAGTLTIAALTYGDIQSPGDIFMKTFSHFVLNGEDSLVGSVLAVYSIATTCGSGKGEFLPPVTKIIGSCVVGKINANFSVPNEVKTALLTDYLNRGVTGQEAAGNDAHNNPNNAAGTAAICYLNPTVGNTVNGTVTLTLNADKTVTYLANVSGLNSSIAHGVHIHGYGDLRSVSGTSVGSHWKQGSQIHALPENATREMGDLGNMCVADSTGVMYYNYHSGSFSTIDNALGRAIIVPNIRDHGGASDLGVPLSQCIIGLSGPTTAKITFDSNISGNFIDEPKITPSQPHLGKAIDFLQITCPPAAFHNFPSMAYHIESQGKSHLLGEDEDEDEKEEEEHNDDQHQEVKEEGLSEELIKEIEENEKYGQLLLLDLASKRSLRSLSITLVDHNENDWHCESDYNFVSFWFANNMETFFKLLANLVNLESLSLRISPNNDGDDNIDTSHYLVEYLQNQRNLTSFTFRKSLSQDALEYLLQDASSPVKHLNVSYSISVLSGFKADEQEPRTDDESLPRKGTSQGELEGKLEVVYTWDQSHSIS
eukprot:gene2659-3067_t